MPPKMLLAEETLAAMASVTLRGLLLVLFHGVLKEES